MAVFVALTTDAFANNFNKAQPGGAGYTPGQGSNRAGTTSARRPLRGLEIKDDTYAILKVIQANGTPVPLADSGSPNGQASQTSNFILQSVREARMEKHQIVETFGEPYIFFFGESPRFLDVSAVLVDSNDFNWYAEFWDNYDKYFRGTKLVEAGARLYMFYDDNIVEGYMLMADAQKVAGEPLSAQLTFRLFLTNYSNVTNVTNPNFPIRSTITMPQSVTLTAADEFNAGSQVSKTINLGLSQAALASQAQVATQQQLSGFGGTSSLSDALRQGLTSTGTPSIDSALGQALSALGINIGDQIRTKAIRGLINDNKDEFTGYTPPTPAYAGAEPPPYGQNSQETPNLQQTAIQQAQAYGADVNNPDTMMAMGLGPNFTTAYGFSMNGSGGSSVSFGVGGMAGFGAGVGGGLNGGLGFTGAFIASPSLGTYNSAANNSIAPTNFGVSANNSVYGNGILVQGGVAQGTGIGGGIPGGMSGGIGPRGPGTLPRYMGGSSYASPSGYSSSQGYGSGLSANGASINIGGAPSAFSLVSVAGTLDVTGGSANGYYTGADGASTDTNDSGYFV